MKLSIAIQSHPARAELAASLQARLPGSEVVADPDPDYGKPNAWRTYRAALEATPAWADHRLILQDDVTLCNGFLEAAEEALAARPDDFVSFYHGGKPGDENHPRIDRALSLGDVFVNVNIKRYVYAVALSWPTCCIQPILDWINAQNYPALFTADDEIIGRGLRAFDCPVLATVPSLVQHEDVVPSLMGLRTRGGRDPARVAYRWLAPPMDARSLVWG